MRFNKNLDCQDDDNDSDVLKLDEYHTRMSDLAIKSRKKMMKNYNKVFNIFQSTVIDGTPLFS